MTSPRSPSFEELLRRLPEEKQYLLDRKVERDRHLAEIAGEVTGWRNVLPYLVENDTEKAEETIFENYPTIERRRLALLQKWREKYGSNATYRNLAKSFYDAGRTDLTESVFEVMACDYQRNTSTIPHATVATVCTRFSSCTHTFLFLSLIVFVLSVLLSSYFFEADSSQNDNHFASQSPSSESADRSDYVGAEVRRIGRGNKTSEVAPNNLPDLPGPFIGRDKEVEYITRPLHFAKHSRTKMVHIFGLPAVGKSTLAVHVGYEMARLGIVVQYINADETHLFRSHIVTDQRTTSAVSKRVSDIELPWYSHTEKKYASTSSQGVIQWAKELSSNTILIIDNCDLLLQNNSTQKAFLELFVDLSKASRFLHILTTSRLKLSLVDGFKLYTLGPLDNESAIELLQSVSDGMTLNDSRTVNELVGGIPLALKIVGSLVSEMHPPNLIISELKQNLIETLTPEDVRPEKEKIRPVLELSYKYLDTNAQECALYLRHFPGSFSHEAASHILRNCTNSNPVKCLTKLTDSSLLNPYSYAGQPRYQFHKLIKEYLADVESRKSSVETSKIAVRFNSAFLTHYTKLLSSFVSRYNQTCRDYENIDRFKHESHNFECLLEKVHCIHEWPIIPFVNLTRSLICQLMLETFTQLELLKVGQRSLVWFEDRMDNISAQIGASETLNLYCDLVLQLRKWICTYPGNSLALCEETFLPNISTRYHAIDKQLAMSHYSKRSYYNQLRYPYYKSFGKSYFCYHICTDVYMHFDIGFVVMIVSSFILALLIAVECDIYKIQVHFQFIFYSYFCFCLLLLFHPVFAYSLGIVCQYAHVISLSTHTNDNRATKILFYIVLYVMLTGALTLTLKKDMAMFHFLLTCFTFTTYINVFSCRVAVCILRICIVVTIIDAYILEIETAHYLSSFVLDLFYLLWGYLLFKIMYILFVCICIVCLFLYPD